MAAVVAAAGGAGRYLHWGVVQISVTNSVIVLVMLALFALAVLLPFPRAGTQQTDERTEERP